MSLMRFVVHHPFLTARGLGAVGKQIICLKTFGKIGAEGPNFPSVTSHSWTRTATVKLYHCKWYFERDAWCLQHPVTAEAEGAGCSPLPTDAALGL